MGFVDFLFYGYDKVKLMYEFVVGLMGCLQGWLVLVIVINLILVGEGKIIMMVGLGDVLNCIGKCVIICICEVSFGLNFGMKGGVVGGGMVQIVLMEEMNLYFIGDFYVVISVYNLLVVMIDNYIYWGNVLCIDLCWVMWWWVIDMNDRVLCDMVIVMGGFLNGYLCESGFDIIVVLEVMVILCLVIDFEDLQVWLGCIVIGLSFEKILVIVVDIGVVGVMMVLLCEVLQFNLVQMLENNLVLVYGGFFVNIVYGCNLVMVMWVVLVLLDYVVIEVGFGVDLGVEKFLDIKCCLVGFVFDVVVLVVIVWVLKMNGGVVCVDLVVEDVVVLIRGCVNLGCYIENLYGFGLFVVVVINYFIIDIDVEIQVLYDYCVCYYVKVVLCCYWVEGGVGVEELVCVVVVYVESGVVQFVLIYFDDMMLWDKIQIVCKCIYCVDYVEVLFVVCVQFDLWQVEGYGYLLVCMVKM